MSVGRTERLAAALVARHELSRAVRRLNAIGVLPMPLKGVLLQHTVYADPSDRMISDADLLVPTRRGADAIDALRAAGYDVYVAGRSGVMTHSPGGKLALDLHWRLFPPGLFQLRAAELFARGRIDETLFDGVVVLPAPLDVYAHLVGNFAKGRHGAGDAPQLRDFSALASRFDLAPGDIARHLERHGLSRAARYALRYAAAHGAAPAPRTGDEGHAERVLAALRPDPVGRVSARLARGLVTRYGTRGPRSLVSSHLVNRTLPQGAVSLAVHLAQGLHKRVQLARRAERRGVR